MKQLQGLLIVLLLLAIGYTYKNLSSFEKETEETKLSGAGKTALTAKNPISPSLPLVKQQSFSDKIHNESKALSQLTDRPEEAMARLKEIAQNLQEEQIHILREKALNSNLEGDERFFSVFVLGESSSQKAQESLEQIAVTPIPKMQDTRLVNQEEIIRGHAIESLREPTTLKRVLSRTDNQFLADRAQRSLAYRAGKVASSPEQQDQEALKKVLKKITR